MLPELELELLVRVTAVPWLLPPEETLTVPDDEVLDDLLLTWLEITELPISRTRFTALLKLLLSDRLFFTELCITDRTLSSDELFPRTVNVRF